MHSHTADISIVVIKGAYLYKDDAGEKRVGPGDYLRVPGGHKHWSGGDKTEGESSTRKAQESSTSSPRSNRVGRINGRARAIPKPAIAC